MYYVWGLKAGIKLLFKKKITTALFGNSRLAGNLIQKHLQHTCFGIFSCRQAS